MGINFDFTELDQLSADLGKVPESAGPWLRKAIEVTAKKIKDSARSKVTGQWSGAADAIDYEVTGFAGQHVSVLEAEIGYNKGRPGGGLGNIREFGAPNAPAVVLTGPVGARKFVPIPGTSAPRPPHNDLQTALAENQADFIDGVVKALDDAEREAGL